MLEDSTAVSLLGMLVSLVVILGMAWWATRFLAGRGMLGPVQGGTSMRICAQLGLGRDQRLLLAQVGGRWFLLGVTAGTISMLAEFTEEEAALWQSQPQAQETKPSFRETVWQAMQKRRR